MCLVKTLPIKNSKLRPSESECDTMSSDKNGDAKNGAGGGGIKDSKVAAKESSSESKSSSAAEQLNLRVIGQDGDVIQFKIKSNTPFRKLMSVYCDRLNYVQNTIR